MVDIESLIVKMTLAEKISLLAGRDLWHTVPVERLDIPSIKVSDGPNGVRGAWEKLAEPSVCLPVGIALGASWNADLVERLGRLLAHELALKNAHILLAPTVNIHRTPIAGRNFECFAEDPFLSGQIAAAYINGIQDNGRGACIKHYVANDQEFERFSISAEVAERPLREIYLEPFRLAIRAAKPWAVMSAYNKVNGTYASEHRRLLKKILKGEWGFDGIVMSDWFGTYTPDVPGGGLDLEMPGPARWMAADHVEDALAEGRLSIEELDEHVRRILRTIERAGAFEEPPANTEKGMDRPEDRRLLRQAARETIVLLKNESMLPLDRGRLRRIAVIGELARRPNILGGGSSRVVPHPIVSPLEGIRKRAGSGIDVSYARGYFIHRRLPSLEPAAIRSETGDPGLQLELFDNLSCSGEAAYKKVVADTKLGWFYTSVPVVDENRFSARLSGTFTAQESGRHLFGLSGDGHSRLFIDGECLIDYQAGAGGAAEETAGLDLVAGQAHAISLEFVWDDEGRHRAFHLGCLPPHGDDLLAEAAAVAKQADVAIVVVGLTEEWESEGFDRVNMKLPGRQDELITAVTAANPRTIVVLNAGSALEMPWIDQVPAVVDQWYNGQEVGSALADILFGEESPSGKLPTTFPRRLEDNPAYINYPGENGRVRYGEGLFVGYRYYDEKDIEPLFPFGHGLSYTTFEYTNLRLSSNDFHASEGVTVSLDISNTGSRPGKEVVQLYVAPRQCILARPPKELKAFAKIHVNPGATEKVSFYLGEEAFWFYDPAHGGWRVEEGQFELLVGASSRDIRLRTSVDVSP